MTSLSSISLKESELSEVSISPSSSEETSIVSTSLQTLGILIKSSSSSCSLGDSLFDFY
jgi:hypothetical protein